MHLAPAIPHPMARQIAVPRLSIVGVVVIVAVIIGVAARKEGAAEKSMVKATGKALAVSKGPRTEMIEGRAGTTPEPLVEVTAKARMRPAE